VFLVDLSSLSWGSIQPAPILDGLDPSFPKAAHWYRHKGVRMVSEEFNPDWDVYRDDNGRPVTITAEQVRAIWHAMRVVDAVRAHESHNSLWTNPKADIYKSRLLGRILVDGRPPTRTRPPLVYSGPDWSLLPGGDPFTGTSDDAR
jgi:hypothetical protein